MILAVIFGLLAAVSLYAALFYTIGLVKGIVQDGGLRVPSDASATTIAGGVAAFVGMTGLYYGLAFLFGWLCARNAKNWRRF
jgi:hypothetical protein